MCTDQTGIQEDYVEQRDRCREDAQLRADTSSSALDDSGRKAALISAFSECMAQNGWSTSNGAPGSTPSAVTPIAPTTPFGQNVGQGNAPAAAPAAIVAAPTITAPSTNEKAYIARASECAFARESASVSSIAATRAKACDLECQQYLKAAPEAPRPAACPADYNEDLATGSDKE